MHNVEEINLLVKLGFWEIYLWNRACILFLCIRKHEMHLNDLFDLSLVALEFSPDSFRRKCTQPALS